MPELRYFAAGNNLSVAFDTKAVEDKDASRAEGTPKYKEVDYIHLLVPGDRNSHVHRPVRDQERERFAKQYEHWKKGQETPLEGIPLESWAGCSKSQVEELRHKHVRTVEQLAGMSESNAKALGLGFPELRQRARDFIESAKGSALLLGLREENTELLAQVAELREHLTEARAESRALRAQEDGAAAPRRGRKPKPDTSDEPPAEEG
jgi:hypothetical protein